MHDLINFLKGAVGRGAEQHGVWGCYIVRKGAIYARNEALQAGVAFESEVEFNIPAEALDLALTRMKQIESLTVNEDNVVIKSGRLRSTIKYNTLPMPEMPAMAPKKEWRPTPAGLIDALKLAIPFMGERVFTQGIRLMDGRVTAVNGASAIDLVVDKLKMAEPVLITKPVAEFLVAQGAPARHHVTSTAVTFQYDDGRWVRAQLLNDKYPPNVDGLFLPTGDATFAIDDDWREAYADAVALSDGKITITSTGFKVRKNEADSVVEHDTGLPEGHESYWDNKVLGDAVKLAERWNPTKYPEPCSFEGPGYRGLVVGLRNG